MCNADQISSNLGCGAYPLAERYSGWRGGESASQRVSRLAGQRGCGEARTVGSAGGGSHRCHPLLPALASQDGEPSFWLGGHPPTFFRRHGKAQSAETDKRHAQRRQSSAAKNQGAGCVESCHWPGSQGGCVSHRGSGRRVGASVGLCTADAPSDDFGHRPIGSFRAFRPIHCHKFQPIHNLRNKDRMQCGSANFGGRPAGAGPARGCQRLPLVAKVHGAGTRGSRFSPLFRPNWER
jgi:hypothetical protein